MFSRKNHHSQRRGSILKSARGNKTTSAGAGSAEKKHWTDLGKMSKYYYKYISRDVFRQKSDPYLHHIGKPPEKVTQKVRQRGAEKQTKKLGNKEGSN